MDGCGKWNDELIPSVLIGSTASNASAYYLKLKCHLNNILDILF